MSVSSSAEKSSLTGMLGRFWTAANVLTLTRFVLIGPITYLIVSNGPLRLILVLIAVAVLTDWVDGRLARWSRTVSDWGKVLDPLADKLAAAGVTVALLVRDRGETLPYWFIALVIARDVLIVAGSMYIARRMAYVTMSLWLGKITVGMLAITVLAALLTADPPIMQLCVLATTVMLVLSFLVYAARFVRLMNGAPEPIAEADEQLPTPS